MDPSLFELMAYCFSHDSVYAISKTTVIIFNYWHIFQFGVYASTMFTHIAMGSVILVFCLHVYMQIAFLTLSKQNSSHLDRLSAANTMCHSAVLLCLLESVIVAEATVCCQRSSQQSLFLQYCCNASNYGQTYKVYGETNVYLIVCSSNRPQQCSSSCSGVAGDTPGYYDIVLANGSNASVFCGCDGDSGWTRVAYLNMSDPSQQCPTELRLYNESGVRACGRQTSDIGSCDSLTFSTNGISYSQVCGRVIGYQYGHTDAIHNRAIDGRYVEGISITHGSPRQHIWTLAAGHEETGTNQRNCPCNTGSTASVPSFVGDDYFCESGTSSSPKRYQLYPDDPLWDGEGCGGNEGPCCNAPGIPWFHKVLNSFTTDDIEVRVCGNSRTAEDAPVSLYEVYIK